MAEKALNIIVNATDKASVVLNQVGDSAGGLGNRLEALEEAGHGFHGMLRSARNIFVAFEIIPTAVDAAKAAFATLTGSAEDAAKGQRALLDGIKEIPVVGKVAAEASEFLGSAIAHALGRQSTADIEAEIKKKEETLKEFAETQKKLAADFNKSNEEATVAGLNPTDAAIQKAKNKFADQMRELGEFKKSVIAAAGEGADTREATDQIRQIRLNDLKTEQDDIAKAHEAQVKEIEEFNRKAHDEYEKRLEQNREEHEKQLADDAEFAQREAEIHAKSLADTQRVIEDAHIRVLEASGKQHEASLARIRQDAQSELEAVKQANDSQIAELDKSDAEAKKSGDTAKQKTIADARVQLQMDTADRIKAIWNAANSDTLLENNKDTEEKKIAALKKQTNEEKKVDKQREPQAQLATLDNDFYTTGVAERAQQDRSEYQPIVDATDKHAQITQDILNLLQSKFNAANAALIPLT